jgi:hypothetical protein
VRREEIDGVSRKIAREAMPWAVVLCKTAAGWMGFEDREDFERWKAASIFGRIGGLSRSPLKAEASRINGAKGGRPKKLKEYSE